METMFSERGNKLLIVEKYTFRRDRETATGFSYRCTKRGCPAALFVDKSEEVMLQLKANHNHSIDEKLHFKKLKNGIKRKAAEDIYQKPAKIINSGLKEASVPVDITPRDMNNIRRSVYRSRKSVLQALPRTSEDTREATEPIVNQTNKDEDLLLKNRSSQDSTRTDQQSTSGNVTPATHKTYPKSGSHSEIPLDDIPLTVVKMETNEFPPNEWYPSNDVSRNPIKVEPHNLENFNESSTEETAPSEDPTMCQMEFTSWEPSTSIPDEQDKSTESRLSQNLNHKLPMVGGRPSTETPIAPRNLHQSSQEEMTNKLENNSCSNFTIENEPQQIMTSGTLTIRSSMTSLHSDDESTKSQTLCTQTENSNNSSCAICNCKKASLSNMNEFEVFGQSVGIQLSRVPLELALQLQADIQNLITSSRLNYISNKQTPSAQSETVNLNKENISTL